MEVGHPSNPFALAAGLVCVTYTQVFAYVPELVNRLVEGVKVLGA